MQSLQTNKPFSRRDRGYIPIYSIFDVLKVMDQNEKNLVVGFIRHQMDNPPELIIIHCIWFYFQIGHDSYTMPDNFDKMNLKSDLLCGIYKYGFERPSFIQKRVMMPLINGHNVIVHSHTGTGKSATHCIAALQRLDHNEAQCQVLIVASTRAKCTSIHKDITCLGYGLKISTRCFSNVNSLNEDKAYASSGIQIAVGTIGRIRQMIDCKSLKLNALKLCVVDDADAFVSRALDADLISCLKILSSNVQIALFLSSHRMPKELMKELVDFTEHCIQNPLRILQTKPEQTLDGIAQYYVAVEKEDYKLETLFDLYEAVEIKQAIIFCNTRRKVIWLADQMKKKGFLVGAMHGDVDPTQRGIICDKFQNGVFRILISTDLLARRIENYFVTLVINYDLPMDMENYLHRIGRIGAYGRKGWAINFVCDEEESKLRDMENFYNTQINELPMNVEDLLE